MSGLGGEDGTGGGEVVGVGDLVGSSKVSGDSDVLDGGGETEERVDVGVGELVRASIGGGISEGGGEESDVASLVHRDLSDSSSDPGGLASGDEGSLVELAESLRVEGVLEVLEGQGVVEDLRVDNQGISTRRIEGGKR